MSCKPAALLVPAPGAGHVCVGHHQAGRRQWAGLARLQKEDGRWWSWCGNLGLQPPSGEPAACAPLGRYKLSSWAELRAMACQLQRRPLSRTCQRDPQQHEERQAATEGGSPRTAAAAGWHGCVGRHCCAMAACAIGGQHAQPGRQLQPDRLVAAGTWGGRVPARRRLT